MFEAHRLLYHSAYGGSGAIWSKYRCINGVVITQNPAPPTTSSQGFLDEAVHHGALLAEEESLYGIRARLVVFGAGGTPNSNLLPLSGDRVELPSPQAAETPTRHNVLAGFPRRGSAPRGAGV